MGSLAALVCASALASTPTLSAADAPVESVVEIRLNGATVPEPLIVRFDREGGLLLRETDLELLRLQTPPRAPLRVAGQDYYRFVDGDGASLRFDAATQTVELSLPASAFRPSAATGGTRTAPPRTQTSPGGFLNYEVSLQQGDGPAQGGAFLEAGVFGGFGVLTSSGVVTRGADSERSARYDTSWTRDYPERLASLRLGDSISGTGAWGRALRFAGVQYATNFATQPTLVTTPLLTAGGEAIVPSTVEVFVNGLPSTRLDVPPGPFTIDNVPAVNGAGELQVVVTDALGRQQVLAQPFYSGTSLLQPGLDQFSFELGTARENYGWSDFDYGDWIAAATSRRGLSDAFTAELHAEGSGDGTAALGADAALRIGRIGILSATLAGGGDDIDRGWLAGLGFEHSGRRFSVFGRSQWYSRGFAQLGTDRSQPTPRQQSFLGLGLQAAPWGSFQLAWGLQRRWSGSDVATLGGGYSRPLGAWGFLNLSASLSSADERSSEIQLGWTVPFGERSSMSSALRHRGGAAAAGGPEFELQAGVQQSLPVGSGSGYELSVSTSDDLRLGYAYQGKRGQLSADFARQSGSQGARVGALGGLAIAAGAVIPTRVLDQSFAVVTVADYAGIPVYVDNQPIGVTDRKGRVLIDRLRAYEMNEVRVDALALPMDASLARDSIEIAPAWRSGAVVAFPVKRSRAATFRLLTVTGAAVPAGALVQVGEFQATVAREGLVYLEDSAPGAQSGVATWPLHSCRFTLTRSDTGDPVPDLGTLECRETAP